MLTTTRHRLAAAPTPMAGLALGIASLGWCWENTGWFDGQAQALGAGVATVLLIILTAKFLLHPRLLAEDLAHPVVGSVLPTTAMTAMVISVELNGSGGAGLWLLATGLHLVFLILFLRHRLREFRLHHMVPSWFIPPVGIIVAAVTCPGGELTLLARGLMWFGLGCYGLMLPLMLYRLCFVSQVPEAAKPTIAILAAPASLSLTGYLTITDAPDPLLVTVLFVVAVMMTALIYLALFQLLRLPFNPSYAAFTFPLVISATALFKVATLATDLGITDTHLTLLEGWARLELTIATLVVAYVALRFTLHLTGLGKLLAPQRIPAK